MPGSSTNYGWPIPTNAGDNNAWGTELNTMIADVDAQVFTVQGVANAALPLTGSSVAAEAMTGRFDCQTATMAVSNLGTVSGGTLTLNFNTAMVFVFTVGANITTMNLTQIAGNLPATSSYGFILRITNGGAFTITWNAFLKFPSGTAPTLTVSGTDLLAFFYDGISGVYGLIGIQLNLH